MEAARDLGALAHEGLPHRVPQADAAGAALRGGAHLCAQHGLFFIADLLGGNKVVLVGNLIQTQLMNAQNWPFAAALSVVLLVLTTVIIWLYRKLSGVKDLEGIV